MLQSLGLIVHATSCPSGSCLHLLPGQKDALWLFLPLKGTQSNSGRLVGGPAGGSSWQHMAPYVPAVVGDVSRAEVSTQEPPITMATAHLRGSSGSPPRAHLERLRHRQPCGHLAFELGRLQSICCCPLTNRPRQGPAACGKYERTGRLQPGTRFPTQQAEVPSPSHRGLRSRDSEAWPGRQGSRGGNCMSPAPAAGTAVWGCGSTAVLPSVLGRWGGRGASSPGWGPGVVNPHRGASGGTDVCLLPDLS